MSKKKMVEPHSKPPQFTEIHAIRCVGLGLCFFLFGLGVSGVGCSVGSFPKGAPCIQSSDCQSSLKCIQHHCSDGQTGSRCLHTTDCLTGYDCIQQQCLSAQELLKETSPSEQPFFDTEPPTLDALPDSHPGISEQTEPVLDAPTETCQTHQDCSFEQHCLIQADGISLRCSSAFPCQSDKDCHTLSGTVCHLHPDPKDGRIRQYCVFPSKTEQPRKSVGSPCNQAQDCLSALCLQDSQDCGGFCQQDTDCPSDFYCGVYSLLRIGEFGGCYRRCREQTDCRADYSCSSQGRCEPKGSPKIGQPCRQRSHCPTQGDCLDDWPGGTCTQSCTALDRLCGQADDPSCPTGQGCFLDPDTQQHRCAPLCPTGSACVRFAQGFSYCLQICQIHTDCRFDYFCGPAATALSSRVCWPRGTRLLGNLCEYDTDCISGLCRWFPSGRACSQVCGESESCPPRFVCLDRQGEKLCAKACSSGDDCPHGYQCVAGQCQIPSETSPRELGASCTQHSQCRTGQCLQDHPLLPHGYCTQVCDAKTPCPSGSFCAQAGNIPICLKTCHSDAACSRKGYFCHSEIIRLSSQQPVACSTTQPCPTNSLPWACHTGQEGQFCAVGFCLGLGVRQSGQSCTVGWECQSGFCYKPLPAVFSTACRNDQDCVASHPYCEPTRKLCVSCLTSRDCRPGEQCLQHTCTQGGYCVEPCDPTLRTCPPQTHCTTITNAQSLTLGAFCLPTCTSSLQCLDDFICQPQDKVRICRLK